MRWDKDGEKERQQNERREEEEENSGSKEEKGKDCIMAVENKEEQIEMKGAKRR